MHTFRRSLRAAMTGVTTVALATAGSVLALSNAAHAATAIPAHVFAPYVEAYTGQSPATLSQQSGAKYLTMAFIQTASAGSCTPYWDGDTSTPIASSTFGNDIATIQANGGDVIPSFGGYAADNAGTDIADSCTDVNQIAAAYEEVITTYNVSRLDLDIEDNSLTNSAGITRRNQAVAKVEAWAASNGRSVQFSYTLPATANGLASSGLAVLQNAAANGAQVSIANIMTFDYYIGTTQEMATDTQTAANGLYNQLASLYPSKTPAQLWNMIGVTEMIGIDDFGTAETFTTSDATTVENWAVSRGIGEISFWASQRDNGNCAGATSARDNCSGISQSTWYFSQTFEPFTGGNSSGGNRNAFSQIEAESYNAQSGTQTEACTDTSGCGLDVGWVGNGDWLEYDNVDFGSGAASFTARLASGAASGVTGNVEVHIDARSNAAVATIAMSPTGGWQAWVSKTASMSGVSGVHTVYLVFTSSGTSDFTNVNYFTFGQAGNDFSVSVSPSSASVSAGKSATANVNTTVTSGSAQTVTLSASGAPPGASVSFSPSSVTAGGSSTMTVATSSSVAPASYPVTVTGSGASATHSATFTLTVTGAGSSGALSNGGFESGSLSPWTCQSGDMVVTSPVHSGSYALQVTPTSSQTGECDQAVTLSPNTSYTLTGWVLGNYAYIGVSGGASASNWTSSSSWSKLSVSFTTGSSGNVTVYVHGWYAQGNVYADDFTLS